MRNGWISERDMCEAAELHRPFQKNRGALLESQVLQCSHSLGNYLSNTFKSWNYLGNTTTNNKFGCTWRKTKTNNKKVIMCKFFIFGRGQEDSKMEEPERGNCGARKCKRQQIMWSILFGDLCGAAQYLTTNIWSRAITVFFTLY